MDADQERIVLDTIDKFLIKEVVPVARDLEQADAYPHDLVATMRGLGLFGATIGEAYGGLGLPASTYAKIVERFWFIPAAIGFLQGFNIFLFTLWR